MAGFGTKEYDKKSKFTYGQKRWEIVDNHDLLCPEGLGMYKDKLLMVDFNSDHWTEILFITPALIVVMRPSWMVRILEQN